MGKRSIKRVNNLKTSEVSKTSNIEVKSASSSAYLYISSLETAPEEWFFYKNSSMDLMELKASVNKYGVIEPIIVRKLENETFQILSGHLRVQAASRLDLEEIKCEVLENLSDEDAHNIFIELHKDKHKNTLSEFSKTKFEAVSMIKNDLPDYLL